MSVVKIIRMCDIMDIEDIAYDPVIDVKVGALYCFVENMEQLWF